MNRNQVISGSNGWLIKECQLCCILIITRIQLKQQKYPNISIEMKKILSLLALTFVALADGQDHQAQAAGEQVQAGDHEVKADDKPVEGDGDGDAAEGAEDDEADDQVDEPLEEGDYIIGDQPEQGEEIFDQYPQQQLPQQPLSKQQIEDLYDQYDEDKNNLLTRAQLMKALTGGEQQYVAQAQAMLLPLLTKHDKNGDGLDRQQFTNLANDPESLKKTETQDPEKKKEGDQKEPAETQADKDKATQVESKEAEPAKQEPQTVEPVKQQPEIVEPVKQQPEKVEPAKQVLEEL